MGSRPSARPARHPLSRPAGRRRLRQRVAVMQLSLPLDQVESAPRQGPTWLERNGTRLFVHLIRVRAARRYVLRVRPDGALRVTIPRAGTRADALRFVERHLAWALRERTRILAERQTPTVWTGVAGPAQRRSGSDRHADRGRRCRRSNRGDRRPRTARHRRSAACARARAARRGAPRSSSPTPDPGVEPGRDDLRRDHPEPALPLGIVLADRPDCAQFPSRADALSVREYILVHELMHRRQPNHSRRFWSLVQSVCPSFRESERWLRTTGRSLF